MGSAVIVRGSTFRGLIQTRFLLRLLALLLLVLSKPTSKQRAEELLESECAV